MKTSALGRLSLIAICLALYVSLYSQTSIVLVFNGVDSVSGQSVPLDSVEIRNISNGTDTTIYGSTPFLWIDIPSSLEGNEEGIENSISGVYPNPASGMCYVDIQLSNKETVAMELHSIDGRLLCRTSQILQQGVHQIEVNPGSLNIGLLSIEFDSKKVGRKILGTKNPLQDQATIRIVENIEGPFSTKNPWGQSHLNFVLDDTLHFEVYAQDYLPSIFEHSPTSNMNYLVRMSPPPPFVCGDLLHDKRDDKFYETVLIGSQCWMAENLNFGVMVSDDSNQTDNGIIEKYCWKNDTIICKQYGGLYQWDEVMNYKSYETAPGICPGEWHIPSDDEWCILTTFLDSTVDCGWTYTGWSGFYVGGMMKDTGSVRWKNHNTGATNSSGFTAFGAGIRSTDGDTYFLREDAFFWTSTKYGDSYAWFRNLFFNNSKIRRRFAIRDYGYSIRCMHD